MYHWSYQSKAKGKPWLGRISSPLCQTTQKTTSAIQGVLPKKPTKTLFFLHKGSHRQSPQSQVNILLHKISPWKVMDKPPAEVVVIFRQRPAPIYLLINTLSSVGSTWGFLISFWTHIICPSNLHGHPCCLSHSCLIRYPPS